MSFPDRIERTLELSRPPATVWAALTTAEGLGTWFGTSAEVDLTAGSASLSWDGGATSKRLRLERVEEPTVFAFTWALDELPDDDPRRTYVEFSLEPVGGGTRLHMVETGFAQLPEQPRRAAFDSHTEGWTRELGELVDYVDAA